MQVWLTIVLLVGVTFSFTRHETNSILPGEFLLIVGIGLIMVGCILGSARTGKWTTWDGRVSPNRLEWFLGLTGAVLFIAPFVHVLLLFLGSFFGVLHV